MKNSYKDKHVLITGGSEGIGLALAHYFVGDGAAVTILSRSLDKLKSAAIELKENSPSTGSVHTLAADVSEAKALEVALLGLEADKGPVNVAICVAGMCIPKLFKDQTLEEARSVMQVNYWGCYHTAHVLLPGMLSRNAGHLCFVSSMAYVAPMAGYSGYCPTKAAVRHLADCLRSELLGTGVSVSVGYPPDTQTPGFDKENKTKPGETLAVMDAVQDQVYRADAVAKCMFTGLQRGRYHLPNPDFGHNMGLSMVAGLTPRPKWALVEILMAPLLVIIALILGKLQDRAVMQYRRKSQASPPTKPEA